MKKVFCKFIFFHRFASQSIGTIAQLVEQRTENPCVPGSIPGGTTNIKSPALYAGFFYES
jgi:hypothetical protein